MAFETWFNNYLLKVRSNTHKANLQKWYDDVYIGELVKCTNRYLGELTAEKKVAATPKEVARIEAKMTKISTGFRQAEEESKTRLMQQLQEQEKRYNEKNEKIAKKLATSLMRGLREPVVADNDAELPQENAEMRNTRLAG